MVCLPLVDLIDVIVRLVLIPNWSTAPRDVVVHHNRPLRHVEPHRLFGHDVGSDRKLMLFITSNYLNIRELTAYRIADLWFFHFHLTTAKPHLLPRNAHIGSQLRLLSWVLDRDVHVS